MAEEDVGVDPEGFERRVAQYVEWLRVNHFSEMTAVERQRRLGHFVSWCADRGLARPTEVTKPILERYQATLFYYRKRNGQPLALANQAHQLACLKGLFRWLARQNHILSNPASDLVIPRVVRALPKHVLTVEEAERVIQAPSLDTPFGLRDRALLEVLYSTGVRRMELIALRLYDLDPDRRTLMVREGKGRRSRVVPIGDRALAWVKKYLDEARPSLVVPPDEGHLFLSYLGIPLSRGFLTALVRSYVVRAEIGKPGSVHLFRHTCATLMLENGADIRYVQAMLGHARLDTTAIYTHVSIRKLQQVHAATHPAGLKPPEHVDEAAAPLSEDGAPPEA